jgi:hypothetical protein
VPDGRAASLRRQNDTPVVAARQADGDPDRARHAGAT